MAKKKPRATYSTWQSRDRGGVDEVNTIRFNGEHGVGVDRRKRN